MVVAYGKVGLDLNHPPYPSHPLDLSSHPSPSLSHSHPPPAPLDLDLSDIAMARVPANAVVIGLFSCFNKQYFFVALVFLCCISRCFFVFVVVIVLFCYCNK